MVEQLVSVHSLECPITLYLKAFVKCKIKKESYYTTQKRRRRAQENHGKTSRYNHKNRKDSRRDNSRRSHESAKMDQQINLHDCKHFQRRKNLARYHRAHYQTRRIHAAGKQKAREGKQHPDRNAQFEFINTIAKNSSNKEIQSSASIQRRKNSLETSRTRDKHGIKKETRPSCECTISKFPHFEK